MRRLSLIGIGMGDPDDLTGHAVKALAALDVAFVVEKGGPRDALADARRALCERFCTKPGFRLVAIPDAERDRAPDAYGDEVRRWHAARAGRYADAIRAALPEGGQGGFLVWGDPSLYDSTLRIVGDIAESGALDLDWDVVPGLSSLQVLAARHRVALNTIGGTVEITTGRRLNAGETGDADTLAVMLDGRGAFSQADPDCEIAWGAYLGSRHEVVIRGRLGDVAGEIDAALAEGRRRHGWIMDTYIIRRPDRR